MANNQNNVQPKVVTTTTTTTRRRGGRRRRRTPRTPQAGTTTVRRVTTTRQPGRLNRRRRNRFGAPGKSAPNGIRQRITATLGTVGANQSNTVELEMSSLINPLLMKENTGSNQYGPLQIHASTYNLWKLDFLSLKLTPLVGPSAVSGTAVRASLDLSGQPGSPSWSALGARKHKDTNPGRPMTFYISGNDMRGPKEGWFYCSTKNDPKMCILGALQIHTLGKTVSTYTNKNFEGPLFLAELTGQWSFKNYNPQPGLLNLVKKEFTEEPQNIKIHSKPGEPILISIPDNTSMARAISQVDVNADATASEIIWQVCDAAINTAIDFFPPPFSWLFRSGWWFVKRVANKKENGENVDGEPNPGELTFQIYQSINDAQNEVPCISTGEVSTQSATINSLQLMQITPGNTGMQQETLAGLRRTVKPTHDPVQVSSPSLTGQKALFGHIHVNNSPPVASVVMQALTTQQKVYSYCIRHIKDPVFTQNGVVIQPDQIDLPSYPIYKREGNSTEPIGKVYMAAHCEITESPRIYWTTACWKATVTANIKLQRGGNNNRNDKFLFFSPTQSQSGSSLPQTIYNLQVSEPVALAQTFEEIQKDNWYLTTFVAIGPNSTVEFTNYGVKYYISKSFEINTGEYQTTQAAADVGAMMNTATPLVLNLNTTQTNALTVSELTQLRQLLARGVIPNPTTEQEGASSQHDNLEMPPLEGEEEEFQGAVGSTEPSLDTKNWVEFGHRKRPPTPFSPIEEEEEDEDSDLDDDDYAEPPSAIKNLLTPEAKDLYGHLRQKGLSHEQATNAAQAAFPHFALEAWDAAYYNAMADGLSPPTARDLAWAAVSDFLS